MQGGTDHGEYTDPCPEGYYAASVLRDERTADRVRWHGRASWHPYITYSSVLIASGWLAGAWYAWMIDDDGTQLTVCLMGFLSTLFPGVPWRELAAMAKPEDPAKVGGVDEISPAKLVKLESPPPRSIRTPVVEVRKMDEA